jgi:hypothetical protein
VIGWTLHAGLTVRALLRRRITMVILVLLPIAFSQAVGDSVGQSVRALVFGVSWAVGTVAFFATVAARQLEPRLRLAGWSGRALSAGRLAGLSAFALALVAVFWVLLAVEHPIDGGPVALDLGVTALVAVAVGTAVGALATREIDGMLLLFLLAGLQAVVNPFDDIARLLPFWSSRELGTFAVDGPEQGSLGEGLVHALVVVALCGGVVRLARLHRRAGAHPAVNRRPAAPGPRKRP